jgi:deoxyribodipyrimidine photo-lyase
MPGQAADSAPPAIVWFRADLRLSDNRALAEACATGRAAIFLYIFDESPARRPIGGAQRWWLHHSLDHLGQSLAKSGGALCLRRGDPAAMLDEVIASSGADSVYWNRRHDPEGIAIDTRIKASLKERGISAASFDGQLLHEPAQLKTGAGGPFKVYTPFWRAFSALPAPRAPYDAPDRINGYQGALAGDALEDWNLLPSRTDWAHGFSADWQPGERGAQEKLRLFLCGGLNNYGEGRNIPGQTSTSRLSPHLAMGEISPFQVWGAALGLEDRHSPRDVEVFRKELVWREFAYHLLFHFPKLASQNFNKSFDTFAWAATPELVEAWKRGQTGYPIVDAGMRQLWQTGWMHNRVRMAAASFLIKHLMADWRIGEAWFWDTLVDACPANNPASWQWVAGSGADAAPYYRIFNPVLQGEKFDADGAYVRRFVPEIAKLPDSLLHRPWEALPLDLAAAGIELGKTYPKPVVDHAAARARALLAYKSLRGGE